MHADIVELQRMDYALQQSIDDRLEDCPDDWSGDERSEERHSYTFAFDIM